MTDKGRRIRIVVRLASVLGLVLALGLVLGCAKTAPDAAAGGASEAPAIPPTVELVEPTAGAEVPAGELTVKVTATDLEFTMASNKNVPGQGHLHVTLDDRPYEMSVEPQIVLKDVEPGEHKLVVELVQNNTVSFDPPVKQEIEFTAK